MALHRFLSLLQGRAILVVTLLGLLFPFATSRGVPKEWLRETVINKGLYADAPHVKSMNGESLPSTIYNKPYATYLEFYNSYCGFCRRFAPHWKELSEDVKHWKPIVQIGAVDCSLDENGDVCRQFEVTSYPSIRYIPPRYAAPSPDKPQIGTYVASADHSAMKGLLVQFVANETNPQPLWPNFTPLGPEETQASSVLDKAPAGTKVAFIFVQDNEAKKNSTVAEVMLDFWDTKGAVFRRAMEPLPWMPSNLEHSVKPWLFVVTTDATSGNVLEGAPEITKQTIEEKVREHLRRLNLLNGDTEGAAGLN